MGGKILPEECPHNIGETSPHTRGTQPCSPWNCFSCSMADDTNNILLPPLHCDVSFGMLVEEHLIWEILSTICFGGMSASVSLAASAQIWPGLDQGHYKGHAQMRCWRHHSRSPHSGVTPWQSEWWNIPYEYVRWQLVVGAKCRTWQNMKGCCQRPQLYLVDNQYLMRKSNVFGWGWQSARSCWTSINTETSLPIKVCFEGHFGAGTASGEAVVQHIMWLSFNHSCSDSKMAVS